jgi:hypothetical protein
MQVAATGTGLFYTLFSYAFFLTLEVVIMFPTKKFVINVLNMTLHLPFKKPNFRANITENL